MRTISSIEAKNRFGQLLDAAQRAPVAVTKKGRPAAVVILALDPFHSVRILTPRIFLELVGTADDRVS